jgi:hypothetical protein
MADISELIEAYEEASDETLTQVVSANYDLTQSIIRAHPQMAQDAGFELFDPSWAKRYWHNIVSDVTGKTTLDEIGSWAVNASIGSLAELVASHYNLPNVAFPAAVGLSVMLIRAASSSKGRKSP